MSHETAATGPTTPTPALGSAPARPTVPTGDSTSPARLAANYQFGNPIPPLLYEITREGQIALMYRDKYDEVDDFEALIERPDAADVEPEAAVVRGDDDE